MKLLILVLALGLSFSAMANDKDKPKPANTNSPNDGVSITATATSPEGQAILKERAIEARNKKLNDGRNACQKYGISVRQNNCSEFTTCMDSISKVDSETVVELEKAFKDYAQLRKGDEDAERKTASDEVDEDKVDEILASILPEDKVDASSKDPKAKTSTSQSKLACVPIEKNEANLAATASVDIDKLKEKRNSLSEKLAEKINRANESDSDIDNQIQRLNQESAAANSRLREEIVGIDNNLDQVVANADQKMVVQKQVKDKIEQFDKKEIDRNYIKADQMVKQACFDNATKEVMAKRAYTDAKTKAGINRHLNQGDSMNEVSQGGAEQIDLALVRVHSAKCLATRQTRQNLNDLLLKRNNDIAALEKQFNIATAEIAKIYTDRELEKKRAYVIKGQKQKALSDLVGSSNQKAQMLQNQKLTKRATADKEIATLKKLIQTDEKRIQDSIDRAAVASSLLERCGISVAEAKSRNSDKVSRIESAMDAIGNAKNYACENPSSDAPASSAPRAPSSSSGGAGDRGHSGTWETENRGWIPKN